MRQEAPNREDLRLKEHPIIHYNNAQKEAKAPEHKSMRCTWNGHCNKHGKKFWSESLTKEYVNKNHSLGSVMASPKHEVITSPPYQHRSHSLHLGGTTAQCTQTSCRHSRRSFPPVIQEYLDEDGEVNADLQPATNPKLGRRVTQHKVGRLEDISRRPHDHHGHTMKEMTWLKQ